MGRKSRHTARTGDGGAELRHKKRQVKEAERAQKAAELEFYDDPSEDDESEEAGSEGSEFGDEEEVMQLGGSGESDSEAAEGSDSVDGDEDADMDEFGDEETKKRISKMDSKWGKSKKTYYSADTAEFELDGDDEAARDEENAALELQRKQATMMDDEDFGFEDNDSIDDDQESVDDEEDSRPVDDEELLDDQLADLSMLADESDKTAIEQVRKDFSKLSKKDKLQIVNQTAPELLGLNAELENTVKELNEIITPAILKLKEVRKKTKDFNTGIQYLVTRQNLMLNYMANISFYLLLRAEGKTVTDHPVLQHLLALKKQMERMRSVDDGVNMQLHNLLTQDFPEDILDDGLDKFINRKSASTKRVNESTNKRLKPNDRVVSREEKEEAEKFYEATLKEREAFRKAKERLYTHEKPGLSSSEDEIDSEVDEGTKRGASYEIIKNKGLKAHKSKINRNPRVKKRLQYRKAVIRRKGQVRDVRVGEAGRYGGETTGIKSNLTRSRKIRS